MSTKKLRYDNVIFDVDGTILDTFKGVRKCIVHALKALNKPVPSDEVLKGFLGPALLDSFKDITHLSSEEAELAVLKYRELYKSGAVYECSLFDGYPRLFKMLKDEGVILSVASSKPQYYLDKLFEKLDIFKYFDKIVGPSMDSKNSDKAELVLRARLSENAVMVGDRKFDIIAAKNVGIDSIGANYGGFTPKGEFDEFAPTFVVNNVSEIFDIIIKKD